MPLPVSPPKAVANPTLSYKVGGLRWIARSSGWGSAAAVIAACSLLVGCAAEPANSDVEVQVATGSSEPAIYGGVKDDDDSATSGVVALRVGTGGTFELCSGALIAPNVVL